MTNYERLMQEMSYTRMAEQLEKEDFCCQTYSQEDSFECSAPEGFSCSDCIKNWLKAESK